MTVHLISHVVNLLQFPCPKTMQINITGFLERNAPAFVKELWVLLLEYDPYYPQILTAFTSAQKNVGGIPTVLVEKKKEELRKRKVRVEAWLPIRSFILTLSFCGFH